MKPLSLHLKGFAGVQAGLHRNELRLDLAALTDDAKLIAIVGSNGSGKSTIMDNLHPFRVMPSRCAGLSAGSFSYYDHLAAAEATKELTWAHENVVYRSTLLFRNSGTRKTEAYLHRKDDAGNWVHFAAIDGTVSDGKTQTYDHCIETILGNSETFFTSVFNAQNRRPLTSYGQGEIKALLVELLGLERIRESGEKANEVIKRLRKSLDKCRDESARFTALGAETAGWRQALKDCWALLTTAATEEAKLGADFVSTRARLADALAHEQQYAVARATRGDIESRALRIKENWVKAQQTINADLALAKERLHRLDRANKSSSDEWERRAAQLASDLKEFEALQLRSQEIDAAAAQLPHQRAALDMAHKALESAREKLAYRRQLETQQTARRRELTTLGTALKAATEEAARLIKRCSLTDQVPCSGSELAPQCPLLGDAHAAKSLVAPTESRIAEMTAQVAAIRALIEKSEIDLNETKGLDALVDQAQNEWKTLSVQVQQLSNLAALKPQLDAVSEKRVLLTEQSSNFATERASSQSAAENEVALSKANIAALQSRVQEQHDQYVHANVEIETVLGQVPMVPDRSAIVQAETAVKRLEIEQSQSRDGYNQLMIERTEWETRISLREDALRGEEQLHRTISALEQECAPWQQLAKALSNEGLIALCIDQAGPALAKLANDLLVSCYGPRFTVSIQTQVENAKRELKEGFDIVVFDGDTQESKSVSVMSGGERVWINECLARAIAIYLSQSSGRHYGTLFTDESDGPLDPARKRDFMAMKRRVLELGAYEQEYFVTHSTDLLAFADRIINLDSFRLTEAGPTKLSRKIEKSAV